MTLRWLPATLRISPSVFVPPCLFRDAEHNKAIILFYLAMQPSQPLFFDDPSASETTQQPALSLGLPFLD
jgi:hypothetical protein